ncbi:MAG TPA: hypothetical protein VKQ36_09930 [Ktedonobacterales bacterium]|nr:hypothetical protein [Ktedonobacterales bacterium]
MNDIPPAWRLAMNERMVTEAVAALARQGRCSLCGRQLVGTSRAICWRQNIYGELVYPLCDDAQDCIRFEQFIRKQMGDWPPLTANIADPVEYSAN